MIITTTDSIDGKSIEEYMGIVTAAYVYVLPGIDKNIQRNWKNANANVYEMLRTEAGMIGADAVIAVRYQHVGIQLCAVGTAVRLSK